MIDIIHLTDCFFFPPVYFICMENDQNTNELYWEKEWLWWVCLMWRDIFIFFNIQLIKKIKNIFKK